MLRTVLLTLAFCIGAVVSASAAEPAAPATATTTTTTTTAAPAMAAKPQAGVLIVHHKVADYAKWRAVYDSASAAADRKAAGLTKVKVMQSASDPNDVVVQGSFADLTKAQAFASSEKLKSDMTSAGVVGAPEVLFLVTGAK